jgi:hypothetical protein
MGAIMTTTTNDRLADARHGALVGLFVGVALAVLGEAGAAIIRTTAYMADAGIMGFTAVYGLPASGALGSVLGWWGRPQRTTLLALAVAVPSGLVAIAQVALQAMAV